MLPAGVGRKTSVCRLVRLSTGALVTSVQWFVLKSKICCNPKFVLVVIHERVIRLLEDARFKRGSGAVLEIQMLPFPKSVELMSLRSVTAMKVLPSAEHATLRQDLTGRLLETQVRPASTEV